MIRADYKDNIILYNGPYHLIALLLFPILFFFYEIGFSALSVVVIFRLDLLGVTIFLNIFCGIELAAVFPLVSCDYFLLISPFRVLD